MEASVILARAAAVRRARGAGALQTFTTGPLVLAQDAVRNESRQVQLTCPLQSHLSREILARYDATGSAAELEHIHRLFREFVSGREGRLCVCVCVPFRVYEVVQGLHAGVLPLSLTCAAAVQPCTVQSGQMAITLHYKPENAQVSRRASAAEGGPHLVLA